MSVAPIDPEIVKGIPPEVIDKLVKEALEKEKEWKEKYRQELKTGFTGKLKYYDPVEVKEDEDERFCLTPSIRTKLLDKLKKEVLAHAKKLKDGKNEDSQKEEIVKRVHAIVDVITRIEECEPTKKELRKVFEVASFDIADAGLSLDELIDTIQAELDVASMRRKQKLSAIVEEKAEDLIDDIAEDIAEKKAKEKKLKGRKKEEFKEEVKEKIKRSKEVKKKATEEAIKEVPKWSRDEFLQKWYQAVVGRLIGFAYDGKGKKDAISPCGLRVEMGKGTESIQKALDLMAFAGSKYDWEDYYINGSEDVVESDVEVGGKKRKQRLPARTLIPYHEKDWPGCIADIFKGKKKPVEDLPLVAEEKGISLEEFMLEDIMDEGYYE